MGLHIKKERNMRTTFIWITFVFVALWLATFASAGLREKAPTKHEDISVFIQKVEDGTIVDVTIQGTTVTGKQKNDVTQITSTEMSHEKLRELLQAKKVAYREVPASQWNALNVMSVLMPLLMIGLIVWFFIRQGNAMSRLTQSKGATKDLIKDTGVTFADVQGIPEVVEEAKVIVDFLKDPHKFRKLGARMPSGYLFSGGPGVGKTLLAKAIAGEAKSPFISMSASEFVEMFVGLGAKRVRELFAMARRQDTCMIFIDEFDAVAGARSGVRMGGGNDEREQTLNQILHEMDGFERNGSIVVIAATNRPEMLDPAAIRTGRFDKKLFVPGPNVAGREAILKVHVRGKPLAPDVDLKEVARATPGMSGADLSGLCNEAALIAVRKGQTEVTQENFIEARDNQIAGPERRGSLLTGEMKWLVSYHEGGHVMTAWFDPDAEDVHRVTIIPRGQSLGSTWQLPEGDRALHGKSQLLAQVRTLYGGRCAEELVFGPENITTGAGDDLQRATSIVQAMAEKLGMIPVGDHPDRVYVSERGGQFYQSTERQYSPAVHDLLQSAINGTLASQKSWALKLLRERHEQLTALAKALHERETLERHEIEAILGPRPTKPVPIYA